MEGLYNETKVKGQFSVLCKNDPVSIVFIHTTG